MRVTIDGIIYEGTPSEIRDIVENPPKERVHQTSDRTDCPDNDGWNYPRREPHFPNPIMTWWDEPGFQRNWDGSPRVTCCASMSYRQGGGYDLASDIGSHASWASNL